MRTRIFLLTVFLFVNIVAACGKGSLLPTQTTATLSPERTMTQSPGITAPLPTILSTSVSCKPTIDDGLSPSYKPNAPIRSSVGKGHVLTGVVRSSRDCTAIANAKLELWPEYSGEGHPDDARATIITDRNGQYRFECDLPEHIHMRLSAQGYRTLAQNSYHPNGQAEGTFDIVLIPESP